MDCINLNTEYYPTPGMMDETYRVSCPKCGHVYNMATGMRSIGSMRDLDIEFFTGKHLELCEGDSHKTLVKVQAWYKENGARYLRQRVWIHFFELQRRFNASTLDFLW